MNAPWTGFAEAARMTLADDRTVRVELTDAAAAALIEAVYVWTTPSGRVVRIGISKSRVGGRLKSYAADINKRLMRDVGPTPLAEAQGWLTCLAEGGYILASVHQPPTIQTVAGPLRPFTDIERVLLETHQPPFNRRGVKRLRAGADPLADG